MSAEKPLPEPTPAAKEATARGAGQLLVELGPIILFVLSYNVLRRSRPDDAIFIATAVFIVSTLAAIAWCWVRTRRVPPVLLVTGVLVIGFGGLTLYLRDENFMKVKPTFVNIFYALAIFGSLLFRQNIWKLLFGHAFSLPDRVWNILAARWGAFFLFMAAVNEIIRHTQTTDFWVNSRLFIVYPLILGFALVNLPLTMKHIGQADQGTDKQGA
ncbi:MAG: septation protein IspZ [Hyphomonadaceae bacterium]|nr:septation protein IspZ [Hyphomonadaceae bacterium]